MANEFKLPELGENIKAGDVIKVLVRDGEEVRRDQPVIEVETEKAAIEVPSTVAGRIEAVLVKAGDKVRPGQAIFRLTAAAVAAQAPAGAPPSAPPLPSPAVRESAGDAAEELPLGSPSRSDAASASEPSEAAWTSAPAAPSVRRFAREIGVEIAEVRGSGPGGRVSIEDVKAHARLRASRSPQGPARPALPDFSKWGETERRPLGGIRRKTAEHMSAAWSAIPHVTQHDKTDITEFESLRRRYDKRFEAAGGRLTVTAVALWVLARALKKFPQFNASFDEARGELILKRYCHIGVAVDTEHGLLVPVLRDVEKKNLLQLSVELSESADKARRRKLTLEEMQGGSMTITNLGGIGGTGFSPIVNWPEVAILGLSRAEYQQIHLGGVFAPRLILPLSLSYDHRVVDGADGARFLRWVADAFQTPLMLALEGLF